MNDDRQLRITWFGTHVPNWQLGVLLILLFGIPRFILVLRANVTDNYGAVSILFVLMWCIPFLLFRKAGRKVLGFVGPKSWTWMFVSLGLGVLACVLMFLFAELTYGDSLSNWFHYIAGSYQVDAALLSDQDRLIYFMIYGIVGMTFSPIGEEFLYRGVIHQCFAADFGSRKASILDSAAFGLTHLAHFGIIYHSGVWKFLPLPAISWVLFIFLTGLLFNYCKIKTGSIWGAVICHAAYNLAMMYAIFYHVL